MSVAGHTSSVTNAPNWNRHVDQSKPVDVARFISSFPNATAVTHDELDVIWNEAIELARFGDLTVALDSRGFAVDAIKGRSELYNAAGGIHEIYSNFALF